MRQRGDTQLGIAEAPHATILLYTTITAGVRLAAQNATDADASATQLLSKAHEQQDQSTAADHVDRWMLQQQDD
jgi:hypothetical protein